MIAAMQSTRIRSPASRAGASSAGSRRRSCPALRRGSQLLPPYLSQHVADPVEQLVRLLEPAGGFGPAARLALLPLGDPGEHAGDVGARSHLVLTPSGAGHPSISTIRRTGRLLAPSMPVSSSTPCPAAAAVVAHAVDDVPDQHVASIHVRLVEHAVLPAPIAGDSHEPLRKSTERLVQGFPAGRQRLGAIAAPVACRDRPGGHSVARRTISRNSASAASPRRRCSSVVRSGASPNLLLLGRLAVTTADFVPAVGRGAGPASQSSLAGFDSGPASFGTGPGRSGPCRDRGVPASPQRSGCSADGAGEQSAVRFAAVQPVGRQPGAAAGRFRVWAIIAFTNSILPTT
jgi:hypothetical protein